MNEVEKDFRQLVKDEALGHAYIFYGGSLSEELKFARELANFIENRKWEIDNRLLVDALLIDGTQLDLGVDVARSFSEFLYRQPVASSRRTLIVHAAGELTQQAQNAILKISEEPPAHSLIILTVQDFNVLLPPLLSRFQKVAFAENKKEEVLSPAQTHAKELVETFLMSDERGKVELIKNLAKDERDIEEKGKKVVDHFITYLMIELAKKPEQNWRALKHLLHRFTLMNDFQTNRRLQLEAVLQFLK